MKKQASNSRLEKLRRTVQETTRKAAANAVSAGRVVAGSKDGKLVEYGPGALPLSQNTRDEESSNAKAA